MNSEPKPNSNSSPSPIPHSSTQLAEISDAPQLFQLPTVEPSPDPVDGTALLDDLERLLNRFVVLPSGAAGILALWTLHTYAFHLRHVTTYIGIESPEKRCGKTTLLSLLSELVNRPVVVANITSSAIFRVIEQTQPTLFIDEADTFLRRNDRMCGILNAGYTRKTAFVVRVERQPAPRRARSRGRDLTRFSCWCPKIIALIGGLPDTLADRSIVIRMQRKTAEESCERLGELDTLPLRRRCARFVLDHTAEIGAARPTLPAVLNDRAADIWEPLLILADLAGGRWPDVARAAAAQFSVPLNERNPTAALFSDLLAVFAAASAGRMFSRTLVEALNRLPDRAWAELTHDRPMTERVLSQLLRPYDIHPAILRLENTIARGYHRSDLQSAARRYAPAKTGSGLVAASQ